MAKSRKTRKPMRNAKRAKHSLRGRSKTRTVLKRGPAAAKAVLPERVPIDPTKLKQLASFANEVVGRDGQRVVQSIGDNGVTDEVIEKSTSLKIAEVRSILNHLHSYGIVEYSREKNMQNGWFTYTWRLNPSRALANFLLFKRKEYESLKQRAVTEAGVVYYKCGKGCTKLPLEQAWDAEFRCPKCEARLKDSDPKEEMEEIEGRISAIEKILSRAQAAAGPRPDSMGFDKL